MWFSRVLYLCTITARGGARGNGITCCCRCKVKRNMFAVRWRRPCGRWGSPRRDRPRVIALPADGSADGSRVRGYGVGLICMRRTLLACRARPTSNLTIVGELAARPNGRAFGEPDGGAPSRAVPVRAHCQRPARVAKPDRHHAVCRGLATIVQGNILGRRARSIIKRPAVCPG
jgi:hypothetical protein